MAGSFGPGSRGVDQAPAGRSAPPPGFVTRSAPTGFPALAWT
ncbi:hypothetical protein ACVW19_006586 [Streptomyces sp. TE5632]